MKAEPQRAGIFRRALSKLTHNWGLKLLALVMAIIVYYSPKRKYFTISQRGRYGILATGMTHIP